MKILVTGVLGFIGSYFTKYVLRNYDDVSIVGINRFSNQKNLKRLEDAWQDKRFTMYYADFARDPLTNAFQDIEYVIHFGAQTFVDYSIRNPEPFIESNVVGTYRILEEARKCRTLKRHIQISTDEVYGAILEGKYKEDARPNPSNPYSASKMGADALVLAYNHTYGLDTIITRTENNYGPYQGKEKVFPTFIRKALNNEPLPIFGDGHHRRMWLFVEDHCSAIMHLLEYGKSGEIYHVAGEQELENLELAKRILKLVGKPDDLITFVPDHDIRPGHDRRYALNCEKIKATGWKAKWSLEEGFKETVSWYLANQWWLI